MRLTVSILMALLLAPCRTEAQESEADSVPSRYELEGVTVTATRVSESTMEVPLAVNIVTLNQIEAGRGYGLNDALATVPGVLAQSRSGNQDIRLTIRGFGARGAGDRSNAGTTRGIRVLLNGFPQTEPDGRTSFDLIDPVQIQSMEVVRSNASAVWGNAGGGIVNINSVPTFETSFARVQQKIGSFGLSESTLQFGTRISQTKFFGAFTATTFDGWRYNSASDRTLGSIGVSSPIGEKTLFSFFATYARNAFEIPGALTRAHYDSAAKDANGSYARQNEKRLNKVGLIGASLDHRFGDRNGMMGMVYANPKYLQRSERNTFRDFTRYHFGGSVLYRQDWQLSDGIGHTSIVGIDGAYQDGAILFYNLLKQDSTGRRGTTLRNNKREGAQNLGYFVQNEMKMGNRFSVILGLRLDVVTYYAENYAVTSQDTVSTRLGLQDKRFSAVIPKAGVSYMLNDHHSLYANLGGGIEVPAGNETDPSNVNGDDTQYLINPLLDPIRSTTIEVGTKHKEVYSDNDLVKFLYYDVALYWIDVRNDLIPYRDGIFYFTAGKTRRQGIEFAGNAVFEYGLSTNASVTYARNTYASYDVDSISAAYPGGHYKDNKVAGLPDLYYGFSLRYTAERFWHTFAEIGIQGLGPYYADDANTLKVPAYQMVNLTVGLAKPLPLGHGISLRVFGGVNNLMDRKYVSSAFINPLKESGTNLPMYLEPGLPRNVFVSAALGWN